MFNAGTIAKRPSSGLSIVGYTEGANRQLGVASVTLPEPPGCQQNDIFISVFFSYASANSGNPGLGLPPNSTFITSATFADGFGGIRADILRRGASAPTLTYSSFIDQGSNPVDVGAMTIVVRGIPPGLALESCYESASIGSTVGDDVGSAAPRTITTTGNNRLAIHTFNKLFQNTAQGTPTGSWIELFDNQLTIRGTSNQHVGVIDYQLLPNATSITGRTNVPDSAGIIIPAFGIALKTA